MNRSTLQKLLNLWLIPSLLLIASSLLLWSGYQRDMVQQQRESLLISTTLDNVASDIAIHIEEKRNTLKAFIQLRQDLLRRLYQQPDDEVLQDKLRDEVLYFFPGLHAVTLTDRQGTPLLADIEGNISTVCEQDIKAYIAAGMPDFNNLYIHPQAFGYHLDLMVPLSTVVNGSGVFFVSLYPDFIIEHLQLKENSDIRLLVLNNNRDGLIEFTPRGSRDQLAREQFLTTEERKLIAGERPVIGTEWQLVAMRNLPDGVAGLTPWQETIATVIALLVMGLAAAVLLWRYNTRIQQQNVVLDRQSRELQKSYRQLSTINSAQSRYIADSSPAEMFDKMLADVLELTGSEYGFIAEVLHRDDGIPYIKSLALTNIAWDETTRRFYEQSAVNGMVFTNLDTLFGQVIRSGEHYLSNDPSHDPHRGGLPPGHPPLHAFAGLAMHAGPDFVGMMGLANRPGGYHSELIDELAPTLSTCANLISACRASRAARQTAQQMSRFKSTLDQTRDCVFMFDPETLRFFYVNRGAMEQVGYSREELLQMTPYDIKPEFNEQQFRAFIAPMLKGDTDNTSFETIHRHKNGKDIPVEISLQYIAPTDEHARFVAIVRDITERKLAETRLLALNNEMQAVLNSTHYSIITTDPNGIITLFNDGAERLFGYSAEEVIGKKTPAILHDPDEVVERARQLSSEQGEHVGPGFEVFVGRARRNPGFADEQEWIHVHKDGSHIPVHLSVTALQDETGNITGFLGVASDITERKKTERLKDEFISTVSHELRTPLTSIRGSLGLLNGGIAGTLPAQAQSLVQIAYNNTERLLLLINDILDISKIESGKMAFHYQPVNVPEFLQKAVDENQAYAGDRGITLRVTDCVDAWVYADPARLMQVMTNLLSNAVKFSPAKGHVDVAATRDNDMIRFSIMDHGHGIPEKFQSHIFEKFSQADSSDSRQLGGTGLGLNISRSIIEKHCGSIDFDTGAGGTTFYFLLHEWGRADFSPRPDTSTSTSAEKRHILVCEDETDIANLLCMMLTREGFTCDIADNAAKAINMLQQGQYNAMTLDIQLPDMPGDELYQRIRANPETRDIPIVVVSVKADEMRHTLEGSALAVLDWLDKPIDEQRLLTALNKACINGSGEEKPRILHVEDDADIRSVVRIILHDKARVDQVTSLKQAIKLLHNNQYDLVLHDLAMPDGEGTSLLPFINQCIPKPPVIVFSAGDLGSANYDNIRQVLIKSQTSNEELVNTIMSVIH